MFFCWTFILKMPTIFLEIFVEFFYESDIPSPTVSFQLTLIEWNPTFSSKFVLFALFLVECESTKERRKISLCKKIIDVELHVWKHIFCVLSFMLLSWILYQDENMICVARCKWMYRWNVLAEHKSHLWKSFRLFQTSYFEINRSWCLHKFF